jgi:hypothetical protein
LLIVDRPVPLSQLDTNFRAEKDVVDETNQRQPWTTDAAALETETPLRGILKPPKDKFPEDPNTIREGVAPVQDSSQEGIPKGARWTKIDRKLVNPAALEEAGERFEKRMDYVIVLRVLTKKEITKLATRTKEIRDARGAEFISRVGESLSSMSPLELSSRPEKAQSITSEALGRKEDFEFSGSKESAFKFMSSVSDEDMHGEAIVLFKFTAQNNTEMTLREGQVVEVLRRSQVRRGWLVVSDWRFHLNALVPEASVMLTRFLGELEMDIKDSDPLDRTGAKGTDVTASKPGIGSPVKQQSVGSISKFSPLDSGPAEKANSGDITATAHTFKLAQLMTLTPDDEMQGDAMALFDHTAARENELSLQEGQKVNVKSRQGIGWLKVEDEDGRSGVVHEKNVVLTRILADYVSSQFRTRVPSRGEDAIGSRPRGFLAQSEPATLDRTSELPPEDTKGLNVDGTQEVPFSWTRSWKDGQRTKPTVQVDESRLGSSPSSLPYNPRISSANPPLSSRVSSAEYVMSRQMFEEDVSSTATSRRRLTGGASRAQSQGYSTSSIGRRTSFHDYGTNPTGSSSLTGAQTKPAKTTPAKKGIFGSLLDRFRGSSPISSSVHDSTMEDHGSNTSHASASRQDAVPDTQTPQQSQTTMEEQSTSSRSRAILDEESGTVADESGRRRETFSGTSESTSPSRLVSGFPRQTQRISDADEDSREVNEGFERQVEAEKAEIADIQREPRTREGVQMDEREAEVLNKFELGRSHSSS